MCSSRLDSKISTVRCDNGGEYSSVAFQKYFDDKGIQIQYTIPYTSPNNGNAERINQTLTEKSRSLLLESGVSQKTYGMKHSKLLPTS